MPPAPKKTKTTGRVNVAEVDAPLVDTVNKSYFTELSKSKAVVMAHSAFKNIRSAAPLTVAEG